ncbi:MAG: ribokinase [Acidimicrobiia bacterium]|nr:ribokinase [Acidimicrobiia bacterium]
MRVAVIGSYGVGLTMFSPRFPGPGETLTGGPFMATDGGKGSNQAIGAARLGATVSFLTAIGTDDYGSRARRLWEHEGVDASGVIEVDDATMVGIVIVEETGENRIIIAPGALTHLTPDHIVEHTDDIAASDVALVSLEIPTETAIAALRIASETGTMTVLNPAPATPLPDEVWRWVDVVTPNETEAAVIADVGAYDHLEDLAGALHDRTGSAVALTAGGAGVMVATPSGAMTRPAIPPSSLVDTTGAGDSFNAALAVGLASGMSLTDAAVLGTYAGSHAVSVRGVVPALPTRTDLERNGYAWPT